MADSTRTEYAAKFTSANREDLVQCEALNCKAKLLPPGTNLKYMHNVDPSQSGRFLCTSCYEYYLNKNTTVRRNIHPLKIGAQIHQKVIHKNLAQAQRGTTSNPIQAIGMAAIPVLTADMAAGHEGYATNTVAGLLNVAGPSVHLPGRVPHTLPPMLPKGSSPQLAGYTLAHASYPETRQKRIQQAYSTFNAEVGIVSVRVVHMPMGLIRPRLVADLTETVDHIPAQIGAINLKQTLYDVMLPAWNLYSHNYPLSIHDIIMRSENWVELRPRNPDCNVIAREFYKDGGKKGLVFKPRSKAIVLFHIPNPIFNACETHRIKMQSHTEGDIEGFNNEAPAAEFTIAKPVKGKAKRTRSLSPNAPSSASSHLSRPAKRAKPVSASQATSKLPETPRQRAPTLRSVSDIGSQRSHQCPLSPSAQRIGAALKSQRMPTIKEVNAFFNLKSFHVLAYPIEHRTWKGLIGSPPQSVLDNQGPEKNWYLGKPSTTTLRLDLDPSNTKKGGFKLAVFGASTNPMFDLEAGAPVCAKRCYHLVQKVVDENGTLIMKELNVPFEGRRQFRFLMMEVACLVWAQALLDLVYDFVGLEPLPFHVPRFRFVKSVLAVEAIEQKPTNEAVFLLEEVVEEKTQGRFRKYLNNVSPSPLPMVDRADQERAQFLVFSQHVQYWKTKKLVFVSDYQGGDSLLSDPQISSARELGIIFADGNIPSIHANFEKTHKCNYFCQWFSLPTDYELWELDSGPQDSGAETNDICGHGQD